MREIFLNCSIFERYDYNYNDYIKIVTREWVS